MIAITDAITITCATEDDLQQAIAYVARQDLTDPPVVDEARRIITFNVVQIIEAL